MDRAYLMVEITPNTWKIFYRGTYNECMDEAFKLSDDESWMIVRPAREHFSERMTLNQSDIGSINPES